MMFKYDDEGLGLGKWLYWFIGCMVIYGLLTLFPDNKPAYVIGGVFAALGAGIARWQIGKWRAGK